MMSAADYRPGLREVERRLREELREPVARYAQSRGSLTPTPEDGQRVMRMICDRLAEYAREAAHDDVLPSLPDPEGSARRIYDGLLGVGILQELMDDPEVEEIFVNQLNRVFVIRRGQMLHMEHLSFESEDELLLLAKRLIGEGHQLDASRPIVHAQLPDGSRITVVIPPATTGAISLTIRKYVLKADSLSELVRLGTLPEDAADFLSAAVRAGVNMLISGSTGSGKTTLLRALCSCLTSYEQRVLTIEDTPELRLDHLLPNCVALQAKEPNLEGKGAITIRDEVRASLRMRPTRIVVGEVRGAEAFDMLQAMNTGHDGSIGTIHANDPRQALDKLATYAAQAPERIPKEDLIRMVATNVGLVLQLQLDPRRGKRYLTHVFEVAGAAQRGVLQGHELWTLDERTVLRRTEVAPQGSLRKIEAAGIPYALPANAVHFGMEVAR